MGSGRRTMVVVLALLVALAAGYWFWQQRSGRSASKAAAANLRLALAAPGGQPLAPGGPIFLEATLRLPARGASRSGRGASRSGGPRPVPAPRVRIGRRGRAWWQGLALAWRVGEETRPLRFELPAEAPEAARELTPGQGARVDLVLPPDHPLPAGGVSLLASWRDDDLEVLSEPLDLSLRPAADATVLIRFLGEYQLFLDRPQAALEALAGKPEEAPDSAEIHALRGRALERLGRTSEAAREYLAAHRLAMESVPADAQEPPITYLRELRRLTDGHEPPEPEP